ncbi:MAG: permease [Candidatus Woesearchaeota archaeon]
MRQSQQAPKKWSWKAWLFPGAILLCYGILSVFDTEIVLASMEKASAILWNLLPALLFVIALMTVTNKFLDQRKLARILGRDSGIKGTLAAIAAGIISTGAIYVWYPLLAELHERGASWGHISMFLYNRSVKIPLLPVMISYFGTMFVIVLLFTMILGSVLQGYLLEMFLDRGGVNRA